MDQPASTVSVLNQPVPKSVHEFPKRIEAVKLEMHNVSEVVQMLRLQLEAATDAIYSGVFTEVKEGTQERLYTNDATREMEKRRRLRGNERYWCLYLNLLKAERDQAILAAHGECLRQLFEVALIDYRRGTSLTSANRESS